MDAIPHARGLPHCADADQRLLNLILVRSLPRSAELAAFKAEFRDPVSPNYRKGLPADELAARFGPTPAACAAERRFVEEQGFTVAELSANRQSTRRKAPWQRRDRAMWSRMSGFAIRFRIPRRSPRDRRDFWSSDRENEPWEGSYSIQLGHPGWGSLHRVVVETDAIGA